MLRVVLWITLVVFLPKLAAGEWAETTLAKMSLDEKIGQLFIIPVSPLRNDDRHQEAIHTLITQYGIGGIIIKQGLLEQQFTTINHVQSLAPLPLLVVADAEWGLTMRASDALAFPRNRILGALSDLSLIEEMGKEVGRELHALGVHMNLAPVVDIDNNPLNTVIGSRSFSHDPQRVADCAKHFACGLQSEGVLGCAKHFFGHGDTAVDSHRALPFIARSLPELEQIELLPFQAMIDDGIAAVMSGHIVASSLDAKPASLSRFWMTEILGKKMGFRGLIISDALNMQALVLHYPIHEIALLCFQAGHHLLLYGDHINPRIDDILENQVPTALAAIKAALLSGEISEQELDQRVRKILETKEKLGLHLIRGPTSFDPSIFHNESAEQLAKKLSNQIS